MAALEIMIDLREFPKPGVRVPRSLKRRVEQFLLDNGESFPYVNGKDLSMEGLFAACVLDFLESDQARREEILKRRIPELIAKFEGEMPGATPAPKKGRSIAKKIAEGGGSASGGTKSGRGEFG